MHNFIKWLFIILIALVPSFDSQQIKVIRSIDEIVQVKPRFIPQNHVSDIDLRELFLNVSLSADDKNSNHINRLSSIAIGAARAIRDNSRDERSYEQYRAPAEFCPFAEQPKCNPDYIYRTYDGSCNNMENSWYGKHNTPYRRLLEPAYNDGLNEPRYKNAKGKNLTNVRTIAMKVHSPMDLYSTRVSNLVSHHGQYISHDLSFIQLITDNDDNPIKCFCYIDNPNCIKIDIPKDDKWNQDQTCMTVPRSSASFKKFNCDLGAREQYNSRTHWLDHSTLYGHNITVNSELRTFKNGMFKSASADDQKLKYLPYDKEGECNEIKKGMNCFKAGDKRVNQNMVLAAMHTLWLRCHNGIAAKLSEINPSWDDEKTYQETRRTVIAVYQHVTYNEWLPILVGHKVAELYELYTAKDDYSYNYDQKLLGTIINEFVAAAFRFGHSVARSTYSNVDKNYKEHGKIGLDEIIFNTTYAFGKTTGIDTFLRSTVYDGASKYDTHVNSVLNNHLFENPAGIRNKRLSLAAVNLLRGREHGIRPYVEYRHLCGLNKATSFDELYNIPKKTRYALKKVYDTVEEIDLFTGGTAERAIDGGVVGATFACIIAKQFKDLKLSDRHFYNNGHDKYTRFTPIQLNEIKKVTMSDILCEYSDIKKVQKNAFLLYDRHLNPWIKCDNKRSFLNYTNWKDYSQYEK